MGFSLDGVQAGSPCVTGGTIRSCRDGMSENPASCVTGCYCSSAQRLDDSTEAFERRATSQPKSDCP